MSRLRYVKKPGAVSFAVDGTPTVISSSHPHYQHILIALESGDIEKVRPLLTPIRQHIAESSDGMLTLKDDRFVFEGEELNNGITQRLLSMVRDGLDVKPGMNLLRNLLDNPSWTASQQFMGMLDRWDLPQDAEGYIYAYKVIRADWTDCHSGKFDNSPGKTVRMRRNLVEDNPNKTCSSGLHFASLHYVKAGVMGTPFDGRRLVVVRINPRDVVSIPTDYSDSKGRCCKYVVVKEIGWNEVLPSNYIGKFKLIDLGDIPTEDGDVTEAASDPEDVSAEDVSQSATDTATDDAPADVAAPVAATKAQSRPGERVYTPEEEERVMKLLRQRKPDGSQKHSLMDIARQTGMSRWAVGRLRAKL